MFFLFLIYHLQLHYITIYLICLQVYASGGDPDSVAGDFGRHSLYKMLGYFSLVGLLRLHSLLGDYYQAIKVLENIELHNKKVSFYETFEAELVLTLSVSISESVLCCTRLPDFYCLLCRLCLYDDEEILRRDSHFQLDSSLHPAHKTVVSNQDIPK